MKEIFQEILKAEEKAGGFIPGEPDDDIFLLESQQHYPIEIPDFTDDDIRKEAPQEQENDDDTIYDVPEEGSVWDIFDEKPPQEQVEDEPDSSIDDLDEVELDDIIPPSDDKSDADGDYLFGSGTEIEDEPEEYSESEDSADGDYLFGSDVEIEDEPEEYSESKDDDEALYGAGQIDADDNVEALKADEPIDSNELAELQKSLQEDLNKKPRKSEKPKQVEADDKPLYAGGADKNEIFVDITNLKFDAPSTTISENPEEVNAVLDSKKQKSPKEKKKEKELSPSKQEEIDKRRIEAAEKKEQKRIEKEKEKERKEELKQEKKAKKEEKEQKAKPFPILKLMKYAAIFILVAAIGIGGYYAYNKYGTDFITEFFKKEDNQDSKEKKKVAAKQAKEKSLAQSNEEPKKAEVQKEEIRKEEVKKEEVKKAPDKLPSESVKAKAAEIAQKAKSKVPKPAAEPKAKVSRERKSPNETKPHRKVKEPKVPRQPSDLAEAAPKAKKIQTTSEEVYTVQVYSTLSPEDAELWQNQLAAKSIQNIYISTQKIRDQIWYRVRFGFFSSREEARSVAMKYGFSQSWIDRIK